MKISVFLYLSVLFINVNFGQIKPNDIQGIIKWSKQNIEKNVKQTIDSLEKVVTQVSSKNYPQNAELYLTLSRLYIVFLNDHQKAFDYLERLKWLAMFHWQDPMLLAKYHNGLGTLYIHEENNKELAFKEFTYSFKLLKEKNIEPSYDLMSNYAVALLAQDSAQKALIYFQQSRAVFYANKNDISHQDSSFLVLNASNIGVSYINLGFMDSAEYYLKRAIELSIQLNQIEHIFHSTVYLGVFYQEQGRNNEAITMFNQAQDYLSLVPFKYTYKALLFESLADVHFATENYLLAHQNRKLQIIYSDSARNHKFTEFTYSIQYKNEINDLELKNKLAQAENRYNIQRNNSFIAQLILIMVIIILVLIYLIVRLKKQRELNQKREYIANLEKEKLAQEAEIALLKSHEKLVSAEIEIGVMGRELNQFKTKLQDYLNKSHDPQFDGLHLFLKQVGASERKVDKLKLLDEVISFSNNQFYQRLKLTKSALTEDEIKLLTFIRLNLSQEDLLDYFGIAKSSLNTKRYRIRKKLKLNAEESLEEYLMKL
jgi:flagellar biogenesis protein FliO